MKIIQYEHLDAALVVIYEFIIMAYDGPVQIIFIDIIVINTEYNICTFTDCRYYTI